MVKNWENSSLVIHDPQRNIFDASAKEKGLSIKPKTREFHTISYMEIICTQVELTMGKSRVN